MRRRILWSAFLVAASVPSILWFRAHSSGEKQVRAARQALQNGNPRLAGQLIDQALADSPASAEVLVAAGEIAERSGDSVRALTYYDRVPADGTMHEIVAAGAAGDLLLKAHRLSDAESRFRRILEIDPQHVLANRRLAAILTVGGRRRESAPYLLELARLEVCDADELALLGNLEQVLDNEELLEQFHQSAPDDPLPVLGLARAALQTNRVTRAVELLKPLVASQPHLREARVLLGKLLAATGSPVDFLEWHAGLSPEFNDIPEIWAIRGRFAELQDDSDVALRCDWEALRRDPNQWEATDRISVLLTARRHDIAARFAERARQLKILNDILEKILAGDRDPGSLLTAGHLTESLGRLWEAGNWYRLAFALEADVGDASHSRMRIERQLESNLPQVVSSANPALAVDFSSLPLPRWEQLARRRVADVAVPARDTRIEFTDVATAAGIRFTYENGADHDRPGFRCWQSFGGGVGVIDFDGDGWPDLHFTQGGQLPPPAGARQPEDRLFRNLGNGAFLDVTGAAGVGDADYGQGVAAGDFNNDGFPDLYVANIGQNRLWQNHGDGTFADVTRASGLTRSGWTASCLIADLDGDGLPDVYDATYLAGRSPFERECTDPELHEPRICPPTMFDGEDDRLYVNRGDGTFADVTASAGLTAPGSKGLGVVAADFELRGRLNLFVANDTTPNLYFCNETPRAGAASHFVDRAVLVGCAYNAAGRTHANMGIAVGDADGDGLLDLYVTAFDREYSVLYLQRPGGTFADRSSEAGLKEPSTTVLGFGTQFIDADLDGWADLVVANGHVDDYTKKGRQFRMQPQFYRNLGQARFAELPASSLGGYFQQKLLGRGLAKLDWNRDGREDFAVSHLDSPAALVSNQSRKAGHFLALQLRGVDSSRDAVGATVRVTAAGRTWMQQITAGDGYYASNQKQLIFGLADAERIDEVRVRWPSGHEQRFDMIPSDGEYIVVEGRPRLDKLPGPR